MRSMFRLGSAAVSVAATSDVVARGTGLTRGSSYPKQSPTPFQTGYTLGIPEDYTCKPDEKPGFDLVARCPRQGVAKQGWDFNRMDYMYREQGD